ncbi:MAG: cyclic nucleotide-binding domain-containing protein [Sneathiellaceae bacterium]
MDDPAHANPFRKLYYGDNQDIFSEGENGDVMYFVERGEVRIWTGRPPNDRTLSTIGSGGFFGEMALIDGKPRSANATACGDVEIRAIPGTTLRRKLHNADPFVKALVRILVENLRSTTGGRA